MIFASSLGTAIEWYDFYIFGTLAPTLAPKFYPPGDETVQLLLYLSTFAVGFIVRPFGAIFFGRIGDLVGRKYAFLVTLLIMGSCTAGVGLLPSYASIGYAAPILLILFRILQGLALGGEYGGAAIYVAEHVPDDKRGFYTSFIQVTATLGLFIALIVVIVTQRNMSAADFARWGYRIPFLISIILVGVSLYIRLKMKESPIFQQLKDEGKTSKTPLADALKGWDNWKRILTTLFGATAGQAVVWYTGQFYALFYLTTILKLDTEPARWVIAVALLARHAAVHLLRCPVRPDRAQEDHDVGDAAGLHRLHPDLPRDAGGGPDGHRQAQVDQRQDHRRAEAQRHQLRRARLSRRATRRPPRRARRGPYRPPGSRTTRCWCSSSGCRWCS